MNVLFLSAWYPHRYDAMAGLFVQKHAEAVSLYANIKVLYVHADDKITDFEIVTTQHHNVEEIIVYYPALNLSKLGKTINYFSAYKKGLDAIKRKNFNYQIIHLHTIRPSGLIAYFRKIFNNKPYVITEHWSRYLTTKNTFENTADKLITKLIVRHSLAVMPVSNTLKNGMIENGLKNHNYVIVNNVVEDFFFQPKQTVQKDKKRILHISCFDEKAKNLNGILRSIEKLLTKRTDFELIVIGTGIDFNQTVEFSKTLNLPKNVVQFLGEKTPQEVSEWFKKSDVFVLFSNYETAGVVISESLVSGTPVISTKVGIAPEMINDSNGKLIEVGDEQALTEALDFMLDNLDKYSSSDIQNNVNGVFSYENIGKKIVNVYETCVKS